jgi:tetratricopeptide (TPR) repeat protein
MNDGHRSSDGRTPAPGVHIKDNMLLRGDVRTRVECPSDEAIAGYLDDRLSADERRAVEEHLASCDDCRTILAESVRALDALGPAPAEAPIPPIPFPQQRVRTRRIWLGLGLAAAAAVLFLVLRLPFGDEISVERRALVTAVADHRTFAPRLVGGFRHAAVQGVTRSGTPYASLGPEITIATAQIAQLAERDRSPAARALYGASLMITGDLDRAIAELDAASGAQPGDAHILSDLSGAYYVRAERQGRKDDYRQALDAARRAVALDGRLLEARFNLALATEQAGSPADARAAWEAYLQQDSSSSWADEARRHLTDLQHGS